MSWYEAEPRVSLELVEHVGVGPSTPVIDVGGGASALADTLVARGLVDVTVLDVSVAAIELARQRSARPDRITWIRADLLDWSPPRRWELWHDRAVFHFLTDEADRAAYRSVLHRALAPGGVVVVGTFAEDGPTSCSGLPVERYGATGLLDGLGPGLEPIITRRSEHVTPSGAVQPFTWVVARARPDPPPGTDR